MDGDDRLREAPKFRVQYCKIEQGVLVESAVTILHCIVEVAMEVVK